MVNQLKKRTFCVVMPYDDYNNGGKYRSSSNNVDKCLTFKYITENILALIGARLDNACHNVTLHHHYN